MMADKEQETFISKQEKVSHCKDSCSLKYTISALSESV